MPADNELSFLPDGYVANRRRQRATRLGMALLAVVMAGVGGAFFVAEQSVTRLKTDYATVTGQYDMAAAQIRQFEQLKLRQEEVSRRARLAASLVEQMPRSAVIAEVRARLPLGVTLQDMSLTSAGPGPCAGPRNDGQLIVRQIHVRAGRTSADGRADENHGLRPDRPPGGGVRAITERIGLLHRRQPAHQSTAENAERPRASL
ncbi:MAG: hypothetical protein QM770_22145 [Tepidisphaeraceae bacterium]